MKLRVLSAKDVRQALPMQAAIAGMKVAFEQLPSGRATIPLRNRIDVPAANGVFLVMPAFLPAESGKSLHPVPVQ